MFSVRNPNLLQMSLPVTIVTVVWPVAVILTADL